MMAFHRYESKGGVATLSQSSSDSTELISSPYLPCCGCDLSSDASSTSSDAAPSSPESGSSPPPPTLHPISPPPTAPPSPQHSSPSSPSPCTLLGHTIMTAVSAAVLAASGSGTAKTKVPNTFNSNSNTTNNNQIQIQPTNPNQLLKPNSRNLNLSLPLKNCDPSDKNSNSSTTITTTGLSNKARRPPLKNGGNGGAIKNIFAAALNFHQQQQKEKEQKSKKDLTKSPLNSNSPLNSPLNNNNNSTTLDKNQPAPDLKKKSFILHEDGQRNKLIILSPTSTNSNSPTDLHKLSKKPANCSSPGTRGKKRLGLDTTTTTTASTTTTVTTNTANANSNPNTKKTENSNSNSSSPVVVAKKLFFPSTNASSGGGSSGSGATCATPKVSPSSTETPSRRKRKLTEDNSSGKVRDTSVHMTMASTVSVEATAVQAGRICSVEASANVKVKVQGFGGNLNHVNMVELVQPLSNCCMWKGCKMETSVNILEHIQTVHVAGQMKTDGYVCLWEGCKVFNRKSPSLSWLERHVLSRHSGNKPFKCIFPRCGQSFGAEGALHRHVNSHISTNGMAGAHGASGPFSKNKLDNSPLKGNRRKKQRCRKQRLNNIGQHVDYFDKRTMEVIKHRLATAMDFHTVSPHDCTFRGQVVAKRTAHGLPQQVLVHWFPENIIPDEWTTAREYKSEKVVPLTKIPKEKLALIFAPMFPPSRTEKIGRKRRSTSSATSSSGSGCSSSSLSSMSSSSSTSSSSLSFYSSTRSSPSVSPSPTLSTISEQSLLYFQD